MTWQQWWIWRTRSQAWLNGVNADYTELYNAVRDLLSCHAELSSVESELQTRQNDETEAVLSGDELRARSREATEELARSEAEYMKATGPLSLLKDKILETREVLRKLEEESVEKEREVDVLYVKWKSASILTLPLRMKSIGTLKRPNSVSMRSRLAFDSR